MIEFTELRKHDLIYLGSPYSKFTGGLHQAFTEICQIAGKLISNQIKIYSPIAHCHPIALAADLDPLDHRIWVAHNHPIEVRCDALIITCMDGWRKSQGLAIEYHDFRLRDAPIYLLKPAEWKLFEVSPNRTLWFDVNGVGNGNSNSPQAESSNP
jgi:hypothetical protein